MSATLKWLLAIAVVVILLSIAVWSYRKAHCEERLKAQAQNPYALLDEGEVRACYGDAVVDEALRREVGRIYPRN